MLCTTSENLLTSFVAELLAIKRDKDNGIVLDKGFKFIDVAISKSNPLFNVIEKRDFEEFKNNTPTCNHPYFFDLDSLLNNN